MKALLIVATLFLISCAAQTRFSKKQYEQMRAKTGQYPVSEELGAPGAKEKFEEVVCEGITKKECKSKYYEMVHHRMSSYYDGASVQDALNYCNGRPVECQDTKVIEGYYIELHNLTVANIERRDREIARERSNKEWAAFGQSMQQQNYYNQQNQNRGFNNQPQPRVIHMGGKQTDCYTDNSGHTSCSSNK